MNMIENERQLEERLSAPSAADIQSMRSLGGDIVVLGAGGKMGPSLAKRAKRASQAAGVSRRVIAVSRFSAPQSRQELQDAGVETISCDLLDRAAVQELPDCDNVIFLAGRKFGSSDRADLTWAMNSVVPANVATRYRHSRLVAFSTGNVYPFVNPRAGPGFRGSIESDELQPHGEYDRCRAADPRCVRGVRLPAATRTDSGATWIGCGRGRQPWAELHHGVPDDASFRRGQIGPARANPRRGRRGRHGAAAVRAPRRAGDVRYLFIARGVDGFRPGRYPNRLPAPTIFSR